LGAARPCDDYREQVHALPHVQIPPQQHPGLRVSVFFFDISTLLCPADPWRPSP
jgi:hypothetical protein